MKILEIASMVITIIGFVATIIFGILPLHERMDRMEEAVLLKHFAITYPVNDTIVESSQVINGRTPFLTLKHYILAAPMDTNDVYVQDGPLKISRGGSGWEWQNLMTLTLARNFSPRSLLLRPHYHMVS